MFPTDRILRSLRRDERGGASLIAVIGMGAALSIVLGTAFLRSSSQLDAVGKDRGRQQSIQVADAGIDDAVARLVSSGVTSGSDAGFTWDPAVPSPLPSTERDWALAHASTLPTQPSPHGEWVQVIPQPTTISGSSPPQIRRLIYSVGYILTRAAPRHIRVIRAEYDFTNNFAFEGAILTDGDLGIEGNPEVLGSGGSAHANGNVTVSGAPPYLEQSLTAQGSCSGGSASTTGDGMGCQASQPNRAVPKIVPRNYYYLSQYDLCPDGQAMKGPAHPSGTPGQQIPCTGAAIGSGSGQGFNGWKWDGSTWSVSGGNTVAADGVYYVYLASAAVSGGSSKAPRWLGTIIAEASATGPEPNHCPHSFGDISISGNRKISAHTSALGLLAVAGRDLSFSGTASGVGAYEGIFAAHEQFDWAGTADSLGVVIANDACDTTGSTVSASRLRGTASITHNNEFDPPFAVDALRVTRWLEL